jgi:hypothetical protein
MPPYHNGRQLLHFQVDVVSAGRDHLHGVLAIAFSDVAVFGIAGSFARRDHATHVLIEGKRQMTFFQSLGGDGLLNPWNANQRYETATAFPEPIRAAQATEMAWDWLQTANFGDDESDGGSYHGWRVFNQDAGIVDGHWEAFVTIQPMWIYIPK